MSTTNLPNTSETIYNAWLAEAAYANFDEALIRVGADRTLEMKKALKAIDANQPDAESNFSDVQAVRFAVWYQRQQRINIINMTTG